MFKSSVKTLPDFRSIYVPEGPAQVKFCARRNWVRTRWNIYVYTRQSSWNPNSNTLEPDRPQHDRPAACVIAQQYFSITLVILRCHSHKEEF